MPLLLNESVLKMSESRMFVIQYNINDLVNRLSEWFNNLLKGGVSDFWLPMLIFQITKTNTPLPQKCLAPILIA